MVGTTPLIIHDPESIPTESKMKSVTDGNGARRAARIILDHLSGYEM